MDYLYKNEEIQFYDPIENEYTNPTVILEDHEEATRRGAAAQELMRSAGWEIMKEWIDSRLARYQADLEQAHELPVVYRLQAGIRVLRDIESFLTCCVWEAKLATDNQEAGPNQGEHE